MVLMVRVVLVLVLVLLKELLGMRMQRHMLLVLRVMVASIVWLLIGEAMTDRMLRMRHKR